MRILFKGRGFAEDSERTAGTGMQGDEWRFLPVLFPTTEQTFTESFSVGSIGTLLCAVDAEMNKTLSQLSRSSIWKASHCQMA